MENKAISSKIGSMLRSIPLFSCLNDAELQSLETVSVIKIFAKNTVLFSQGDDSDSFYVVCSGQVNVGINDEEGREIILTQLGTGEYFGEMALLDGEPRSAYVMTREKTTLLIISKNDFYHLLSSNPKIMLNLLKGLQKRLREANKKIESLALMNVYGRVARILIQKAGSSEPGAVIEEKITHHEIASMVGASREMITRVLKELVKDGYISIQSKRITILERLPYEL
jgi:CRP/FNR family cyclic AMP-dependent transcriptional regulator